MSEGSLTERLLAHSRLGKATVQTVPTNSEKWWCAIVLGVLFALISSSFVYSITNNVVHTWCGGGATILGVFIHTLVYILIVRLLLM
jgi:protein-S-isoprenylcysteine O-methyltransferase Ste14